MFLSKLRVIISFVCFYALTKGVRSSEWKYSETQQWYKDAPQCGNSAQSPINIDTMTALPDARLGVLKLMNYSQTLSGGQFINNGHSVQLNFPKDKSFRLAGNEMTETYTALQLHFHWVGSGSDDVGSEHSVNGHYYDAEMHIVHIKDPYTSVDDVKSMQDGLAVIGVFLKVKPNAADNPYFQMLLDTAKMCVSKGETANLENGPSLISLIPESASYYRYNGSLTTPPCYETVLWTIYQNPVIISKQQLDSFQSLKKTKPEPDENKDPNGYDDHASGVHDKNDELGDNYRPVQPLNGRIVTAFFDIDLSKEVKEPDTWHYEGRNAPDSWSSTYEQCHGKHQSPINFISENINPTTETGSLELSSAYHEETSGQIINNGHTIMYKVSEDVGLYFTDNKRTFQVVQVHFHWGSGKVGEKGIELIGGSEHTVDGKHFPMEMHIVHKKVPEGGDGNDNLAVIAVFLDYKEKNVLESQSADDALQLITKSFDVVNYLDEEDHISDGPKLYDFFPKNKTYYRYMGSLTTPPCSETVMWTVYKYPVYVSTECFLTFQSLYKVAYDQIVTLNNTRSFSDTTEQDSELLAMKEAFLVDNYRPTQPLGTRSVTLYIHETVIIDQGDQTMQIILWTVLGLVVFVAILTALLCCNQKKKQSTKSSGDYTRGEPVEEVEIINSV
ncbi:unnamed protein product [Clavelina lepadiformis]|uniref:Carbonic anhydrase n=1 Tax=Clavelina lepadiformis TaxID=159417 RepID=A0ABP0F0K7_CLALP